MKRISIVCLILLACAVGAPRLRAAGSSVPAGSGGVQQLNEAFLKAMQAGDINGVMKLYGDDAVFFPPGEKVAKGLEEIRYKWNSVLEANKVTEGSLTETRYVEGVPVVSSPVVGTRYVETTLPTVTRRAVRRFPSSSRNSTACSYTFPVSLRPQ